jgi:hypothetical protein
MGSSQTNKILSYLNKPKSTHYPLHINNQMNNNLKLFDNIQHEDVFMRMFTQSLEGEVIRWFRNLAVDSISSWTDFHDLFLHKWAERKSHHQYLTKFYTIRRRNDEIVTNFNRRFENSYHNFPVEIHPSKLLPRCTIH